VATHGLFAKDAGRVLGESAIDDIVITDTVPPFRLRSAEARAKLTVLDAAALLAEAIRRIHEGGSIVELLAPRTRS
jgi:ribose-phosphate pyrophosphokinase